ncbi:class I SAM-dependent methyltransferase [Planococcus sp. CAU13]|uniref:class I SAM-dependent methyltransferase n=1 Tax=Planococcus sp. CAU13 TaxID=1541197 RepID=UPI000530033A|nr:class I SAM-dependent methyltransferase [Planococcus sp. CAU13]
MQGEHGKSHGEHQHHGKISYLENPARKDALSPEKLFSLIPIKETDTVLDFGAGTGYFTIPAAKKVGGNVYALDTDASMLEIIRVKAVQENLSNVIPIYTNGSDIPLPGESVEGVIASLVLHEITPLAVTLAEIKRIMKPEGYLVCIELEPKGESKAPRISSVGMERELKAAGLQIVNKLFPSESLYILVAQKA